MTLRTRIKQLEKVLQPQKWFVLRFFDAVTREPVEIVCEGFTSLEQLIRASMAPQVVGDLL